MPIEVRSLNHAALLVSDVDRSRYFYGEVLGMEEVPRPPSFDFPGAWFRAGNTEVHIIGEDEPGRAAQLQPGGFHRAELSRGHVAHIAFEVANLEAAQQHLRSHGIEIAGGPRPRGDGVMQMYVLDPDNYVVELFVYP
jgi:catechol 2,3-dioxygenase-like lactoylglutathione lyase family enzyme